MQIELQKSNIRKTRSNKTIALSDEEKDALRETLMHFFVMVEFHGAASVQNYLKDYPMLATMEDEYGCTPIHSLGDVEFAEVLSLLLQNGADINAKDKEGRSLLHYHDYPINISKIIKAGGLINLQDHTGRTPLMHQISQHDKLPFRYQKLPMVKVLLYHGANAHLKDKDGKTALDFALEQDDPEFVKNIQRALDGEVLLHPEFNNLGEFESSITN